MKQVIGRFSVEYLQVLNEKGDVDQKLMPKLSAETIKQMYEEMLLVREFDDKAFKLQRQGRLGTYAPMLGQEASQVAAAHTLDKNDVVVPAFRENGVYILRGMPMSELYQYWGGDERGMKNCKKYNMFPVCITVGEQPLHAVGYAFAIKIKKEKRAVLTFFGDGATSEGDFHEAMNFAGVFKLPLVLVCQNNQWAISVPVHQQTASSTIAQKAIAYGFKGIKVDGNDVFGMYAALQEAMENARKNIPTLIESFTFRMADHTTADDASRYRSPALVQEWKKKDPVERLRLYLQKKKLWNMAYEDSVHKKVQERVEEAVAAYEAIPPQPPEEMFKHVYAEMPTVLKLQLEEFMKEKGSWQR